jgi:hypothetical protein
MSGRIIIAAKGLKAFPYIDYKSVWFIKKPISYLL